MMFFKKQTVQLLDGGVTQDDINKWKAKHKGGIHKIKVIITRDGRGNPLDIAYGYIRDVNNDTQLLKDFLKVFSGHKAVDAFLFLLKKAWLGGDKRCLTIESIMISAAGKAATTVDILKDKNAVHQLFK